MKFKPNNRPVPPKWKHALQIEFHRQFTRVERLKILCGFNADIKMAVTTEFHPGKFSPAMDLAVTPAIKPRPSIFSRLFKRKPKP